MADRLLTHLRSLEHLPLVEDLHGVDASRSLGSYHRHLAERALADNLHRLEIIALQPVLLDLVNDFLGCIKMTRLAPGDSAVQGRQTSKRHVP